MIDKFFAIFSVFCFSLFIPAVSHAGPGTWTSNGPEEAWPLDFVFDPGDAQHVYMGTVSGGVLESVDGGVSWASANRGLPPSATVNSLAVVPTSPLTLFASVGDQIFRSVDEGATWLESSTGLIAGVSVFGLTVHPGNPSILLAQTFDTATPLYRSIDGGLSWSAPVLGLPASAPTSKAAADPLTAGRFVMHLEAGLYVSLDDGENWSVTGNPFSSAAPVIQSDFLFDPVTTDLLLATSSGQGIHRSINGGASWDAIDPTGGGAITSSPLAPMQVHVASFAGARRSIDNGVSYSNSRSGQEVNVSQAAFAELVSIEANPLDSNVVLAGGRFSGVFRSTDGGASWVASNTGLRSGTNRALAFDPATPDLIYAATGDGFTRTRAFYRSTDNGLTWNPSNNGLTVQSTRAVAVDLNRSGEVYVGGAPLDPMRQGIAKSIDSGLSWNTIDSGLPNLSTVREILVDPSVPASPGDPATVYLGSSGGVFKSVDGGANWNPASTGFPAFRMAPEFYIVIDLAMAPGDPQVLYATLISGVNAPGATQGGVYRSANGGATWMQVNGAGMTALPDPSAFAVAVDPRSPDTVYAANSDTSGSGWIYKSTDGGGSWNAADAGISVRDLRALLIDASAPDTVYAASGGSSGNPGGVFQSRDGGTSWNSISIGLLDTSASALLLDPANPRRLLAGTLQAVNEITLLDDEDADGASDAAEAGAPNGGDGNGDMVADASQDDVVSLPLVGQALKRQSKGIGASYVTASVTGCSEVFDAVVRQESELPDDGKFSYDNALLAFELPNCEAATMTLTFHGVQSFAGSARLRTFGPLEPGNASRQAWFDVPGASFTGDTWTFNLADGAPGDFRGDTGTIRFLGGVGALIEPIFGDGFEEL